jgi:hypothetical protein
VATRTTQRDPREDAAVDAAAGPLPGPAVRVRPIGCSAAGKYHRRIRVAADDSPYAPAFNVPSREEDSR